MLKPGVFTILVAVLVTISHGEPCYYNTTSCIPVNSSLCLTSTITFSHTSWLFTNLSQSDTESQLRTWGQLRGVPECWAVIQPFLCSVYFPKCDSINQRVERPNREMCERIRSSCLVVTEYNGLWLSFLECDRSYFAESCGQTHFETASFDTEGECTSPLIRTTDEESWFENIQGCGTQCEDPLYTDTEHKVAHIVIAVMGSICVVCTVFTLLTFIIDWKVGRKYPAIILFFINGCFFIASLGWMAQFINREDIVCRKDGTVRKGEPKIGSGESASCTIVFILVYYFTIAGLIWFVMLAYSWDITFKAIGTARDDLSKKTAYFHIISWCLPLVMTIVLLSISEVDGDSMSGICFPGYFNTWIRTGFVLVPVVLLLVIGLFYCVRGMNTLLKVRKDTPPFISDKATTKIKESIWRLGTFMVLACVFVIITISVHIYTFTGQPDWNEDFRQYAYCKANVSVMQYFYNQTTGPCELFDRPSVVAAIIHLLAFFGACIAFSSWIWTKGTVEAWQRLFRRIFRKPVNKPQKIHKHRMVARSFKRRKHRNNERLSISYGTDHDDPVGMRFDRSSMSSQSLSSGFAVAVPKHVHRRRGMMHPLKGMRRRLSESDISNGSRRSSRRTSARSSRHDTYESSMSQKLSDIERDIREEERKRRRIKKRRKRQNKIQPILEPISSTMAGIQERRQRQLRARQRHKSDSSDISQATAQKIQVALHGNRQLENMSLGSSNILSESVTTDNSNKVSEIEMPQDQVDPVPDFSIFTASSLLPVVQNKAGNSNGASNTTNLKGTNPSPSGSFRRGRRREVKLEMTETSFYQEDDDNIEMGGNKTINTKEICEESGEIRQNLKELGPLVNEIFEQARANSSGGRNSGQRDPMGSSRLGSASSRCSKGSHGSKGSQSNMRDLKYANTKVKLPDGPSHDTSRKRPFSGDYILRRNNSNRDLPVRKSRSQPGSRVSSATSHKRQIGNNGRIMLGDGISWSRFLQSKGHAPGQIFTPTYPNMVNQWGHKAPFQGQLQITDSGHIIKEEYNQGQSNVLNVENEHRNMLKHDHFPDEFHRNFVKTGMVDVLDLNEEPSMYNVLNVEQEQNQNLLHNLGRNTKHKRGLGNIDVLNIEADQSQVNILNIEEEHRNLHEDHDKYGSASSNGSPSDNCSGNSTNSGHKNSSIKAKNQSKGRNKVNLSENPKQSRHVITDKERNHIHTEQHKDGHSIKNSRGYRQYSTNENGVNYCKENLGANESSGNEKTSRKGKKDSPRLTRNTRVECSEDVASEKSRYLKSNDKQIKGKKDKYDTSLPLEHLEHTKQSKSDTRGINQSYESYDQNLELAKLQNMRHRYDYVDYELDDEYTGSEFTDDLTDTYTYTSYDDDLTEVSSLPC